MKKTLFLFTFLAFNSNIFGAEKPKQPHGKPQVADIVFMKGYYLTFYNKEHAPIHHDKLDEKTTSANVCQRLEEKLEKAEQFVDLSKLARKALALKIASRL